MAYHSYSDDERMAFTEHINNSLAADPVRECCVVVWWYAIEEDGGRA